MVKVVLIVFQLLGPSWRRTLVRKRPWEAKYWKCSENAWRHTNHDKSKSATQIWNSLQSNWIGWNFQLPLSAPTLFPPITTREAKQNADEVLCTWLCASFLCDHDWWCVCGDVNFWAGFLLSLSLYFLLCLLSRKCSPPWESMKTLLKALRSQALTALTKSTCPELLLK